MVGYTSSFLTHKMAASSLLVLSILHINPEGKIILKLLMCCYVGEIFTQMATSRLMLTKLSILVTLPCTDYVV